MSVPFNIYGGSQPGSNTQWVTLLGFFFRVAAAPASDTTLVDYDGGATMYYRIKLTSALHVVLEYAAGTSGAQSLDLSNATAASTGVWYWVWSVIGSGSNNANNSGHIGVSGAVVGPGGVGPGRQNQDVASGVSGLKTVNCQLGIGVSVSTSYLAFPNTAGNDMSKFYQIRNAQSSGFSDASGGSMLSHGPANPPNADNAFSDAGGSGMGACDFEFNGRQPVGAAATLVDDTGNGYDATAGAGGLTINAAGPFP